MPMTRYAPSTMDKNDLAALELSISQSLADPESGAQVQSKLQNEDRIRVGEFCSYFRQMETLQLLPWQFPPCWIDDDPEQILSSDQNYQYGEREAALLLLRMKEFGVSKWHPDPLAAVGDACDKTNRRLKDAVRRRSRR